MKNEICFKRLFYHFKTLAKIKTAIKYQSYQQAIFFDYQIDSTLKFE